MRILITGANGYLGQGIVAKMAQEINEVVATDIMLQNVRSDVEKIECNLFEVTDPYEFFGQPDVLLHLACRDGFAHYSNSHIEDLPKHFHFIEAMAKAGVKHIAVMGSMHEVGFFEGSINENTPCHPTTPYGICKNALRELTQMLCQQNDVVLQWLRGYYIVGNTKSGNSIFSKIAMAEERGEKDFPFTLGQNQYDFIDYNEFCDRVCATIRQTKEQGIINICSGNPEKLAERVERFISDNGYRIRLQYGAFPDRPYDSKAIWGDATKINKIMTSAQVEDK